MASQRCICHQQYGSSPRTPRTGETNTSPKSNQKEGKTWAKADTAQLTTLYVNPLWLVRAEGKENVGREAQSCTHTWHELVITFYRRRHTSQSSLLGGNASESPRLLVFIIAGLCHQKIHKHILQPGHPFPFPRPGRFRVLVGLWTVQLLTWVKSTTSHSVGNLM